MLQFIYGFLYSECSWLFLCNKLWYIIHLCEEFMLKMRRRKKKKQLLLSIKWECGITYMCIHII